MRIDKSEKLVSFKEATSLIPTANGRRLNVSTVWRWAMKGVKGVKLEYVCYGRGMFTTKEALTRFAKNVAQAHVAGHNVAENANASTHAVGNQVPRDKRIQTAEQACERYGI